MLNAITGSLVNLGSGWGMNVNRGNTQLIGSDNLGHDFTMPIMGNHMLLIQNGGTAVTYTPAMQPTARAMARVTEENGVKHWTISYLGHSYSVNAIYNADMASRMAGY